MNIEPARAAIPRASDEADYRVIATIQERPDIHQRDIASAVGISLGMTNVILNRLSRKGWLTIRKVNNRNIRYLVSPKGIRKLAVRSYAFVRRTIRGIVNSRDLVLQYALEAAHKGYRKIELVGRSELDFLVEYAATQAGMAFRRMPFPPRDASNPGESTLRVFSESVPVPRSKSPASIHLRRMLQSTAEEDTGRKRVAARTAPRKR